MAVKNPPSPLAGQLEHKIDLLTGQVANVGEKLTANVTSMEGLKEDLERLERGFSNLVTKILGGEGAENDRARLPTLEREMDNHSARLTRLENITLRFGSGLVLLWGIIQLIATFWKQK